MVWPFLFVAFLVGCSTDETLPETGNSSVPGNSGTPSSEVELVSETTPIPDGYETGITARLPPISRQRTVCSESCSTK